MLEYAHINNVTILTQFWLFEEPDGAGDSIRVAVDRDLPMVAVTLLYRKGYFHQRLDASGTLATRHDWRGR
jgi:hypothetical protein